MAEELAREPLIFSNERGEERDGALVESLPKRRQHLWFRCQSGRRIEGHWTGVPVSTLLDEVDVPDSLTHLLVESEDGYRACISVTDALDATLALQESRTDCDATLDVTPRLVGPQIDGPRAIKRIDTIRAIQLQPGEDPSEYEQLPEE